VSDVAARAPLAEPDLRDALDGANLPTLLLVLAHVTGDDGWLTGRFRPSRTRALDDNDTAGLDPERRHALREAAFAVLRGVHEAPPPPDDTRIVAMLSASLGEEIPPEYAEPMAEDGGFREPAWLCGPVIGPDGPRVLVIGAGASGICMGHALRRLGLDFSIVERNADVGGTWLENTYPGAGVDTPSHLYSFSFGPRPSWSRYYPKQPEIIAYLREFAAPVRDAITFGTSVVSAAWNGTSWDVVLHGPDGEEQRTVDVVVSCVGQFNQPVTPAIPGLDAFPGPVFHTARWRHDVDLHGKRVGVVGTGASSMQVVPEIAGAAASVTVFQRSPQWITPNGNYLRLIDDRVRRLMEHVPGYRTWYRLRLMWMLQDKLHPTLRRDPDWPHPERSINALNDKHRRFFTAHVDAQLEGAEHLRDAVLPDYPPYGKRILIDNDWFTTIRRDDVELVPSGVAAVEGPTVVTQDGGRHDVDVLVLATGFSSRRMLFPMDVRGRSGVPLREQWGTDDARAHLGVAVPDFPNFFLVYGPNTNLGHGGSTFFHTEAQTGYVVGLLRELAAHKEPLEVRQDVCDAYNARLDAAHEQMIWTHPGMTTYYRNAAGRVVTTTPWRLVDYWHMTRRPDTADFRRTDQ
jgi:4-hydroxyacetophenone monooxygenase